MSTRCSDQTAACLRSLPVSTILANETAAGYTPNINSEVLPQTLQTAFATGEFNRVPIINGTNHDEYRLFVALSELEGSPVTAANYQAMISATLGVSASAAAVIAAEYPLSAYPSPSVALGAVGTDAIFACPALTIDQSVSNFVPTFGYEFNDENAPEDFLPPVSFPYGAPPTRPRSSTSWTCPPPPSRERSRHSSNGGRRSLRDTGQTLPRGDPPPRSGSRSGHRHG